MSVSLPCKRRGCFLDINPWPSESPVSLLAPCLAMDLIHKFMNILAPPVSLNLFGPTNCRPHPDYRVIHNLVKDWFYKIMSIIIILSLQSIVLNIYIHLNLFILSHWILWLNKQFGNILTWLIFSISSIVINFY